MTLALIAVHQRDVGAERAAPRDRAAVVGPRPDVQRIRHFRNELAEQAAVATEATGREQDRRRASDTFLPGHALLDADNAPRLDDEPPDLHAVEEP